MVVLVTKITIAFLNNLEKIGGLTTQISQLQETKVYLLYACTRGRQPCTFAMFIVVVRLVMQDNLRQMATIPMN